MDVNILSVTIEHDAKNTHTWQIYSSRPYLVPYKQEQEQEQEQKQVSALVLAQKTAEPVGEAVAWQLAYPTSCS